VQPRKIGDGERTNDVPLIGVYSRTLTILITPSLPRAVFPLWEVVRDIAKMWCEVGGAGTGAELMVLVLVLVLAEGRG
jgi:hypothetical protein